MTTTNYVQLGSSKTRLRLHRRTNAMKWKVYILLCSDDTLYTGITTDILRRVNEHNNSTKGARYTRARRPVSLVYHEGCDSRSQASKREHAIKQLSRTEKINLIKSRPSS